MITIQRLKDLLFYIEDEMYTKDVKEDLIAVIKQLIEKETIKESFDKMFNVERVWYYNDLVKSLELKKQVIYNPDINGIEK